MNREVLLKDTEFTKQLVEIIDKEMVRVINGISYIVIRCILEY